MKKRIIGMCALLLLLSGCGTPKLKNGDEAIVKFKDDQKISVDDFYKTLKEKYGLEELISIIDKYIAETEFSDYVETAKNNADSYIEASIEQYESEEKFLEELKYYTNYETIDAYKDYIYLSYLQSHMIEEYAKTKITDKDIEKYYKDTAIGDMEVSHILITSDATSTKEEDTKKAEEAAKKTVEEIIKKLDNAKKDKKDIAKTFEELAKEYSKDETTKDKGGALGKINYGNPGSEYDELVKAAKDLKDGEYSTKVITAEDGYHVILKTKTYEKDSLENLKESITKTLAEKYAADNQQTIGLTALQHYRKEYGMEITDDEIKKEYSNYIQNAMASINLNNKSDKE